jgi:hypothetical protein
MKRLFRFVLYSTEARRYHHTEAILRGDLVDTKNNGRAFTGPRLCLSISKREPESWPYNAQAKIDGFSHHEGRRC